MQKSELEVSDLLWHRQCPKYRGDLSLLSHRKWEKGLSRASGEEE